MLSFSPALFLVTGLGFVAGIIAGWLIRGERRDRRDATRLRRQQEQVEALEQEHARHQRQIEELQSRSHEAVTLNHRQKKQLASTRAALDEQIHRNRKANEQIKQARELLSDGRSQRRTLERQLKLLIKRTQDARSGDRRAEPLAKPKPVTLQSVRGIGARIADQLVTLGITELAQLAEMDDAAIDALDSQLRFPGRIRRDRWVEQAREILAMDVAESKCA